MMDAQTIVNVLDNQLLVCAPQSPKPQETIRGE